MSPTIRILRRLHAWIGLLVGSHFVVLALTGALYIFQPELSGFARRNWTSSAGDVGAERVLSSIRTVYPDWPAGGLDFPSPQRPFYVAYLPPADQEGTVYFWTDVYIDPGTGQVLGEVNNGSWSIDGLLQVAIQLHINLCCGETGRRIVDCSTALFAVELIAGAILWWPGLRRLGRGFRLRLRRNRVLAYFDWHRLSGLFALPLLLVMVLTGLTWGFPEVMSPLVFWCCGETPTPMFDAESFTSIPPTEPPARPLSLAELASRARSRLPDSRLISVWIDERSHGVARAAFQHGMVPAPGGYRQEVLLDKYSGKVLTVNDTNTLSPAGQFLEVWTHPLHYGSFGGIVTKVPYLLATLAVVGLYVTGILVWWTKHRKKGRRDKSGGVRHRPLTAVG